MARFIAGRDRSDLDRNEMLVLALTRAIEIIGEAASRVSVETQNALPDVPWREVTVMRNRLVHAYFDVDPDILWRTAKEAVPALLEELVAHLPAQEDGDG
ncbi:HepT-like ribonuclease domain-containing protein [Rhodocyclaceae bacterium SMB388]